MGLWDWVGRRLGVSAPGATETFQESAPKPISVMFAEMMNATGSVTRAQALSVPAVLKGRNMIASIASLPLQQLGPDNAAARNPLLDQIDPDVTNVVTLAQTVEDLVFEAISWWRVTARGFDGFPVSARRLDPATVSVDPPAGRNPAPLPSGVDPRDPAEGYVYVDQERVPWRDIIRFDSPNPAVLKTCGRSIKRAVRFDQAAERYARNPRPLDYFTPTDGVDPAEDEEIEEILVEWAQSRQTESTAYVPAALSYNTVDTPSAADMQLVELQKQVGLDLANALGVDPEDLGISTTSRTYSNNVDRRRDRINDVLAPYMRAITDRLSMSDVTKRGYRVLFNLDDYLKSNPTERWSTYQTAKSLGVLTAAEIRAMEGLPPMTEPAEQPAEPEPVDEQPVDEVAAAGPAGHTFDGERLTFGDWTREGFAVDTAQRVVEGLIVPWGRSAKGFRFDRGSITWSDVTRVKLLRDHDFRQPLGVATSIADTPKGLRARFKVARGAAGDEALALAEDGVLDGLSVGVDFDYSVDTAPDPKDKTGRVVQRADLRETSLTPMPAFDDARVTKVAASRQEGTPVTETATSGQSPEAGPATTDTPAPAVTLSADQFAELMRTAAGTTAPAEQPAEQPAEPETPAVVNPTRVTASVQREALPYRFDRGGNFTATEHVFSTDLRDMQRAGDLYGTVTDAGKRAMGLLAATFATPTTDVNELNPTINRPDMYVDQRDFMYPLWNAVNKGAPPNGVQPFAFPKFNSASGLVGDHTEGTEPTAGSFTTTNQTVTPTAISGKASITREVYDMGGNPAVSTLIFNQMVKGYREGLESATATFLNTLTAATDITIATAAVDDALADAWDQALAGLAFERGYDFSVFAIEQVLYKAFVGAEDSTGRRLYPILNPQNATGTSASRFRQLDLSGVVGTPSWALASTAGAANNSWLFDPSTVSGWATTPERLEFAGTTAAGEYGPVAMIDIACFGYKAFANSDIGGVRQVIYDSVA